MKNQDEYNQWFRSMLSKHTPNLFAKIEEMADGEDIYLEAIIPHEDERRVISLSTYGRELTPYISSHHCHFDSFEEDDADEEEYLRAIEWINDFMDDKLYVATEYKGDRVVSSMSTPDKSDIKPRKGNLMSVLTYSDDYTILG